MDDLIIKVFDYLYVMLTSLEQHLDIKN